MNAPVPEGRMGFFEHLDEMRRRLVNAAIGLALMMAVVYNYREAIVDFLLRPYLKYLTVPAGGDVTGLPKILSPGEGLAFDMKLSVWGGLILAAPWLFFQLWGFIRPALKPREARVALPVFIALGVLFIAGVAFAYYFLLPPMFQFFIEYNKGRFDPVITLSSLWDLESRFLFWSGAIFELPVAAFLLGMTGLVVPGTLAKVWRLAILGAFILGAVITPTADPINMTLMSLPICALYFVSIGTCWLGRLLAGRKD